MFFVVLYVFCVFLFLFILDMWFLLLVFVLFSLLFCACLLFLLCEFCVFGVCVFSAVFFVLFCYHHPHVDFLNVDVATA